MPGKPKNPPTTEEVAQIVTMTAAGLSTNQISKRLRRSRHMVRNVQAEPEIRRAIKDEKAELSQLCQQKAREVFVSIDAETIEKGNLLQKATAGGILLDKSLLLAGEPTVNVNVAVLLQVAEAIRERNRQEDDRILNESRRRQGLPPLTSEQILQEHLEQFNLPAPPGKK